MIREIDSFTFGSFKLDLTITWAIKTFPMSWIWYENWVYDMIQHCKRIHTVCNYRHGKSRGFFFIVKSFYNIETFDHTGYLIQIYRIIVDSTVVWTSKFGCILFTAEDILVLFCVCKLSYYAFAEKLCYKKN